ncbi:MAG TPA: Crp/Fnr family transcriptional regulator [Micropepsaceae bacterium]|nr:Crp/Fnr family transcriptional regulator [Micropepsaceae bacterium]
MNGAGGLAMNALPEIRVRSGNDNYDQSAPAENPLSRKEQEQLRDIAKIVDCKAGTTLYSQGEQAKYVYLIAEGIVRINHCDETGHRQILVFRVQGDFCGIPYNGDYFNFAETVSNTVVYRFEWHQIQQILLTEPHLQSVLLGKILHDYRQAQVRISILGQQNTCQRLASFLLDFIQFPQFFDVERSCLTLPVNRFDLADYLGTAPESTARAFAKLENFGLIRRITARKIEILDRAGLRLLNLTPRRRNSGHDSDKGSFQDNPELVRHVQ